MKACILAAMEKLHSIIRAPVADSFLQNKQRKIHTHIIRNNEEGQRHDIRNDTAAVRRRDLAASLVGTIVCIVVGHGKKKRLKAYLKEWY